MMNLEPYVGKVVWIELDKSKSYHHQAYLFGKLEKHGEEFFLYSNFSRPEYVKHKLGVDPENVSSVEDRTDEYIGSQV